MTTSNLSQFCTMTTCNLSLYCTMTSTSLSLYCTMTSTSLSLYCTMTTSKQVFGCKDFCGSTVLGTPESVGMNGQIDWQALQILHLVCSLAGQRCSEAWGTFSAWTSQSITALTAWRKEEWRKEAADIPPSKAENDLCSTRQILALFRGQPWGDC